MALGAIETRSLAGILVPDTPLISRAIEYARQNPEPYLFNHVMRSWLFAVRIAQERKIAHDGEVLAVATLLHDLGLGKAFCGPLRFEVEGANAARQFARGEGIDERRAQLIWDGVALNSTPSIGLYKRDRGRALYLRNRPRLGRVGLRVASPRRSRKCSTLSRGSK